MKNLLITQYLYHCPHLNDKFSYQIPFYRELGKNEIIKLETLSIMH